VREELQEIIEAAFHAHDTNEDEVLEEDEAAELFVHFVERFVEFQTNIGLAALDKSMAMTCPIAEALGGRPKKTEFEHKLVESKKRVRKECQARLDNYRVKEDELNEAAFQALDVNKNGTLALEEVVEALTPDTDKYNDLLVALELMTKEEVADAKKINAKVDKMLGEHEDIRQAICLRYAIRRAIAYEMPGDHEETPVTMFLPMTLQGVKVLVYMGGNTWQVDDSLPLSQQVERFGRGLAYRRSKRLDDNQGWMTRTAAWGSFVEGIDTGDGWLQVEVKQGAAQEDCPVQ